MELLEAPYDITLQEDLEQVVGMNLPWKKLNDTTVLVTGATGLIGSQLVRVLLAANRILETRIHVLAMVRSEKKANMIFGQLLKRPEINLLIGDITESLKVEDNVDFIFHTASVTASKAFVTTPVETIITAFEGTRNILQLAKEKKTKSIVYLSSMEAYGQINNGESCTQETELGYIDLTSTRSSYPESKRMCENLCVCYASEYNVPVKIARLAQTFGAGVSLNDNRVFAQFARAAMLEEDIVLHTSGETCGNYCYTADALSALLTILLCGRDGEIYNIVNETASMTIAEMANMISSQITEGKSKVQFDVPDDLHAYGYAPKTMLKLSGRKLCELGWKPYVALDLETMFRRLIASFISQREFGSNK